MTALDWICNVNARALSVAVVLTGAGCTTVPVAGVDTGGASQKGVATDTVGADWTAGPDEQLSASMNVYLLPDQPDAICAAEWTEETVICYGLEGYDPQFEDLVLNVNVASTFFSNATDADLDELASRVEAAVGADTEIVVSSAPNPWKWIIEALSEIVTCGKLGTADCIVLPPVAKPPSANGFTEVTTTWYEAGTQRCTKRKHTIISDCAVDADGRATLNCTKRLDHFGPDEVIDPCERPWSLEDSVQTLSTTYGYPRAWAGPAPVY